MISKKEINELMKGVNKFDSDGLFEVKFDKDEKCIKLIYTTKEKAYSAYINNWKKVMIVVNELNIFGDENK